MAKNPNINVDVWLLDVRLSYPHMDTPRKFDPENPNDVAKYGLTTIIEKGSDAHKKAAAAVQQVIAKGYPDGKPPNLTHCIRAGKEKRNADGTYVDGYGEDVLFINAANEDRFTVVNRNRIPVNPGERGYPYGGCIVNVHMRFWLLDNKSKPQWGKKVCAQPLGVQFVRDAPAFGGNGRSTAPDEFPDLSGQNDIDAQWDEADPAAPAVDKDDPLAI